MEVLLDNSRVTQNFSSASNPELQLQAGNALVDRYLIQDVIGVGGMGSVYRARDLHFPNVVKLVAVKEMINHAPDPLVRQTIVQNFEREADILVTINHHAIPRIYDYFTQDDRSYLVEEYVQGKDLEGVIAATEGAIPEEQIVSWAIELCDVLTFLHSHKPEPIIFRDMKPSNVMINQLNHVILVDFGIAKVFRTGQKGTMIGTEGYSPPEQYRGESSPQADIYALGATLHHLLTKKDPRLEPPFTFQERPISRYNQAISSELITVVNTCLQYEPSERFPTAEAVKIALMKTGAATGLLGHYSAPSTPAVIISDSIKPLWTFECEDEIRGTPTCENNMVFLGSYDNNLYALNATNGDFFWKYATEGGIVGKPAYHDSTVFVGSEDHRLHAVSTRSGKVVWTYYTEGPVRGSPRIAEGHIFVGSDDYFLHAVNLVSSRRVWRAETPGPVRSTPCVSGDYVYFGSESGDFLCVDFRSEVKWRFKAKRGITSSPLVADGVVYFSALDSTFYALDAKSGWVIWRYRLEKGSISSPAKIDNMVIVGAADNIIYCLDSSNAKELWQFKTEHQVNGSPCVYKDAVYCGSVDQNMYCIEYRTGRLRWKFPTRGAITGSPIVYNDILYFGSTDHTVYALLA
ncbi:MAG: serine/threonine-protein kinase [Anaerolineaceae bacterium]|nr:serine/threonine-protein kinase [Anaerolineaceae bacterium]